MHLQHSPRKKNFGYEETIRLLELWTHYTNGGTHPELGKGHRTGRLWLVISERMKAMNYNRGPEECKVRVGNLRAKYTKLKRGYLAGDLPSNSFCDCFPPHYPNIQDSKRIPCALRHTATPQFLCVCFSQPWTPRSIPCEVFSSRSLYINHSLLRGPVQVLTVTCVT